MYQNVPSAPGNLQRFELLFIIIIILFFFFFFFPKNQEVNGIKLQKKKKEKQY